MKKQFAFIGLSIMALIAGVTTYTFYTPENENIRLFGNIDIRQVDISFQVGGKIQDMFVDEGNAVKKGDLLATLDNVDYQAAYDKALAEVQRQTAVLAEATSLLDTNAPLCREDITARRQCISYTNAKDEATAALKTAEINATHQKNQLDYTKVYAPDDGIITVRVQEPGATVQTGQIIYTLAKNKPLWVRTYIPESLLGRINYDTSATVTTDSIDPTTGEKQTYIGRVGYISPVAEFTPKNVETETLRPDLVYRINVYIDEPGTFLRQGMPVTVEIKP